MPKPSDEGIERSLHANRQTEGHSDFCIVTLSFRIGEGFQAAGTLVWSERGFLLPDETFEESVAEIAVKIVSFANDKECLPPVLQNGRIIYLSDNLIEVG